MVEHQVARDAAEPRTERSRAVVVGQPPPGHGHRVLEEVVHRGRGHRRTQGREQPLAVLAHAMSRHPVVCTLDALLDSNAQLRAADDRKARDGGWRVGEGGAADLGGAVLVESSAALAVP